MPMCGDGHADYSLVEELVVPADPPPQRLGQQRAAEQAAPPPPPPRFVLSCPPLSGSAAVPT
eukprot:gene6950-6611_t